MGCYRGILFVRSHFYLLLTRSIWNFQENQTTTHITEAWSNRRVQTNESITSVRLCCNLSVGFARFTTNGMCAMNNTHIHVVRTSDNESDHSLWSLFCLLPQCIKLWWVRSWKVLKSFSHPTLTRSTGTNFSNTASWIFIKAKKNHARFSWSKTSQRE